MAKQTRQTKKHTGTLISQVVVKAPQRRTFDVGEWRGALISADAGRVKRLFDLFEDLLIDGFLADAVNKRKEAVTNSELTFQNAKGEEVPEMAQLIDTIAFEELLNLIMDVRFWGRTGIELDFSNNFDVYEIPKKHIDMHRMQILRQEFDADGISYEGDDNVLVLGKKRDYGLFLKTAPFVIWKRGGFGDWAQWLEIFGMPQRVGKYSMYDPETRELLKQALEHAGSAPYVIIPKESEVETVNNTGNGSSGTSYNDFRKACNEELLITVLGQTLTTIQGERGARSLGEVHKEVEEGKNRSDMRFAQRVLNQYILPRLASRGFPVQGGSFIFPEAAEQLSVADIVNLTKIISIPAAFVHDKYSIPMPTAGEPIAGQSREPEEPKKEKEKQPEEPKKQDNPKEPDKPEPTPKKKKSLRDFFAFAPTKERGKTDFATRLIDSITGRVRLSDKYTIDINKLLQEVLDELYNNEVNDKEQPIVSRPLFDVTNDALQDAIDKTFEPEFGKKNEEFIKEFRHNTAVFAAFKNHRQTKEIIGALYDEQGNLRSFHEFKKRALKISKDYNVNWLRTEYNTAVRAARSAVNYRKFLEAEHLYPNLEYIESTAKKKREAHLEYVGTVLPIRHPWWDTHMPPSDWNCACSVRQTDKETTPVPGEELVPPVFQNNPGKTAEFVKLDEHPYIKGVCPYFSTCLRRKGKAPFPPATLADTEEGAENPPIRPECKICELANKTDDYGFKKLKKYRNGGAVLAHVKVDKKKNDYKDILTVANHFAKKGSVVKITPSVHYKSNEYRQIYGDLLNTKYWRKCPDMQINNLFYEYESFNPPFKKRKISNMISHGTKQASRIIIKNSGGCSHGYIKQHIYRRLNDKTFKREIKEVWIYERGEITLIYKKQ